MVEPRDLARAPMPGETELIKRIARSVPSRPRSAGGSELRVGIGDDAAVLRPQPARRGGRGVEWVLTCDAFLENVHFLARAHPPRVVGYKALARATSDLAAMGAVPRFFLLSLALPSHRTGPWLDGFLAGMAHAARRFGLVVAGGDTARHPTVVVNITVLGDIESGRAVTRSGARPGDLLYISGRLGGAQLGLELVLRGLERQRRWRRLLRPHLYPALRLALGQWLSRRRIASAMIDTSDGLSTDLEHLCRASGVGARLWGACIPTVAVPAALRDRGLDPLALALHGGEDYELLFTAPRRFRKLIPKVFQSTSITLIGEIVRSRRVLLVGAEGGTTLLVPRGWDHFRST